MIGNIDRAELRALLTHGASLEIDGKQFSTDDLMYLAAGVSAGKSLKIHKSENFPATALRSILANAGEGAEVVFC